MRGQRIKPFKRNAKGTESGCRPTTLEDGALSYDEQMETAGMIWEDEIIKDRRRREWVAFYAGCTVGAVILAFSLLFIIKLTGGMCP